jgi:hypothetical protein
MALWAWFLIVFVYSIFGFFSAVLFAVFDLAIKKKEGEEITPELAAETVVICMLLSIIWPVVWLYVLIYNITAFLLNKGQDERS